MVFGWVTNIIIKIELFIIIEIYIQTNIKNESTRTFIQIIRLGRHK